MRIGEVVAGKYRIVRKIGSGAMGVVVAAHHLNLDRMVAIKFLVREALGHPDSIARFVREARSAARIRSPHVVRVHDVAVLESGVPYIELEYLEGRDLALRLRQSGPLPLGLAVDFILQACDAIAEAHEIGIIHRDLKPANLFAVQRAADIESIKVLDFGISKAASALPSTMSPADWRLAGISTERIPIGSPPYMSPEQMQSARDVDFRTDIWALGVTLCELVTGQVPFPGSSLVEVYTTIQAQSRLRLRSRFSHIPEKLETVILKCLEIDRSRRFGSVSALASALVPFGSNRGPSYVQRVAAAINPSNHGTPAHPNHPTTEGKANPATDGATLPSGPPLAVSTLPSGSPPGSTAVPRSGKRLRWKVVLPPAMTIALVAASALIWIRGAPNATDASMRRAGAQPSAGVKSAVPAAPEPAAPASNPDTRQPEAPDGPAPKAPNLRRRDGDAPSPDAPRSTQARPAAAVFSLSPLKPSNATDATSALSAEAGSASAARVPPEPGPAASSGPPASDANIGSPAVDSLSNKRNVVEILNNRK